MTFFFVFLPAIVIAVFLLVLVGVLETGSFWPFKHRIKITGYALDTFRGNRWYDLQCQRCGHVWRAMLMGLWWEECPVCHWKESHNRLYQSLSLLKKESGT